MLPGHDRAALDGGKQGSPLLVGLRVLQPLSQEQIVPANDRVLNEPATAFGQILFDLIGLQDFLIVPEGDRAREFLRTLDFVELLLNRLPEEGIINVAEEEEGLGNFAKFLQGLVQRMLLGVGVESFKEL
jgi:hypothetical protein